MSINKFEISIEKDSNNEDAKLDSMSVEVAKAFLVLVESLTKIVENSPNNHTLKIEVHKGSVRVGIGGTGLSEVRNSFLQVASNQSTDPVTVASWRKIQNLLQSNHLAYKEDAIVDDQKIHLLSIIKNAKPFRVKNRVKPPFKVQIKFFQGRLFLLGGKKNDNIHLEIDSNNTIIIDCTEEQVINANKYLKQKALISAWLIPGIDKGNYKFCSSYYYEDLPLFTRFENFVLEFENANTELESLDKLHDECMHYLNQKDYTSFKKFLQLFNYDGINISIIHSILMLTLPFVNQPDLKDILNSLKTIFDKRLKKLNRKPVIAIENSN